MDRLADEVLQIIFNEIDHPFSFVLVCRRFNSFSKDPYVRAHYFLSRYGPVQALYWALGRGPLITEQVLDVLLSSGAHLSRYLVQIAVHHYFRSPCPFIKTPWVRTLTLSSFGHFLKLSGERFGAINIAKAEDDGTVFRNFIRDSRRRTDRRSLATDAIMEMLEKGKFIPFCSKDPIIAQFPLALAIEPRLLPLAIANGFRMDSRYRDFVFRRIFARNQENGVQDILLNVRELCRLDTSMFVSRTVAAEVLMEAETNRTSYAALKALDGEGDLRFSLTPLVEALIKSFIRVHSITTASTATSLAFLWKDYPSRSPIARIVMLLTVFISCPKDTPDTLHSNLERLNLTPVSSEQMTRVLLSPFVEHFSPILRYARLYCGIDDDRMFSSFLRDVAVRCLEVSSKGNMLRSMCEDYPSLVDDIQAVVATKYRFTVGDLPSAEQERESPFTTKLCRDIHFFDIETAIASHEFEEDGWTGSLSYDDDETEMRQSEGVSTPSSERYLGDVGQETLSQVISRDELDPRRKRSPWLSTRIGWPYKPPFPTDMQHIGRWILSRFGRRHFMTATFLNHAIANHCFTTMQLYLQGPVTVPITLHHFKILARLGHSVHYLFFQVIRNGAVFYFSDNDYLKRPDIEVKRETPCAETMPSGIIKDSLLSIEPSSSSSAMSSGATPTRKRPHRSAAATVKSYAYAQLDSDDDYPMYDYPSEAFRHARTVESDLQLWIKHLSALHKDETKKFNEKKRRLKQSNPSSSKSRSARIQSEFLRTVTTGLRDLRQLESVKKQQAHIPVVPDEGSGSDDDEYQCPKRRRKMSS